VSLKIVKHKKWARLEDSYFSPEKRAETYTVITDKKDPAIPERNQGVEIISKIGTGFIVLFMMSQSKTKYIADPTRNPKSAKESNNFVLPKGIVQSLLRWFIMD